MNEIDKLLNDKYNLICHLMKLGVTKKEIIEKEIYFLQILLQNNKTKYETEN